MLKTVWDKKIELVGIIALMFIAIAVPDGVLLLLGGFTFGATAAVGGIFYFFEVRRKLPYRWTCPKEGCDFRISTDWETPMVLTVAEQHERDHETEI